MKNILCKLGIHSREKYAYCTVTRRHSNGKKYRRNYFTCKRCGKLLGPFKKLERGGRINGI